MNIFTQMATEINRGVNRMEDNINKEIESVKFDIESTVKNTTTDVKDVITQTLVDNNSDQFILIELRKDRPIYGFRPEDIDSLTDQQALKFIAENKSKMGRKELIINAAGESNELSEDKIQELSEDKTQELLEDPQIANIFNDLRKDFPSPTGTPGPINTPGPKNIEGFEDVPLSVNEQVNRHLKQKFIDNFTF